jgi:hypothetical protein
MVTTTVIDYFSTSAVFDYSVINSMAYAISIFAGKLVVAPRKNFLGDFFFFIPTLILFVPLSSYPNGKIDSNRLLYSPINEYVVLKNENNKYILPQTEVYRYIGFAGDHHFLLESGSLNVVVVKDDSSIFVEKIKIHRT